MCHLDISVNLDGKKKLSDDQVTPANKIAVIHNGLDDINVKYNKKEARKVLKISDNAVVFVSVGRLDPPKDPLTTLLAFSELVGSCDKRDIFLFFVGDGTLKEKIQLEINKRNLQYNVFITGFQSDVDVYLAASDVFILSTKKEGLPISILEAMKYSLPVIASSVDGIPEEIIHGQNGFLFQEGNTLELKNYMHSLMKQSELRQIMGNKSRDRLVSYFLISENFKKVINIYDNIEKGRKKK